MNLDPLMRLCVDETATDGRLTIKCKLGLWAVSGPDAPMVRNEARHYFGQYMRDGEYRKLISATPEIYPS